MEKIERVFGSWILRYRWLVMLTVLAAIIAMAAGAKNLHFTTDYRVYFGDDNPQLQAFETLENTYTKSDNVLIVLTPVDGTVFSRQTLQAVADVTERAWQTPFSIRVDSLTNFQHTRADADDLQVSDLVPSGQELSPAKLNEIRDIAMREPMLVNNLVSSKGDVTGINITVQLPRVDETKEIPAVVQHVRAIADDVRAAYPGMEVRLTGMVMMNNAFSESSMLDMQTLVPLSFVVMLVSLGFLLKGFSGTFITLNVILLSVAGALGIGGFLGYPISPPSATAPTVILTVAIANAVHILVTMLHEMRLGMDKRTAIIESLRVNLKPVTLASMTTAIGFLTMNFSDVPPFVHLGNIVASGVLLSWLLSLTLLPAVMSVLPIKVRAGKREDYSMMTSFGDFVVRRRRPLLIGMVALVLGLTALLPRNELNDVFVNYFDHSVQFRADTDYTVDRLTGMYLISYSLNAREQGGVSDPEYLAEVAAFSQWYRQQPETIHVSSITDTMMRLNMNMHGDDAAWYRLPEERDLAAQYLLMYEMSLPYGLDLNSQINIDKTSTKLTATLQTLSSKQVLALQKRADDWIKENTRNIASYYASSPTLMFAHIGQRNIASMLTGTTVALLLISLMLVVALRSLKIGLISMVPNLVPAAMGFGLWGLFVGEVGLALSVVSTMTLGIVVDDSVHFLSKYLRARREKGYNPQDSVRYAFTTVGKALVTTSIVLVLGFLVLAMSSFEVNAGMGALTAIVIALALLADFLLLPTLLMKMEEKEDEAIDANAIPADVTAV